MGTREVDNVGVDDVVVIVVVDNVIVDVDEIFVVVEDLVVDVVDIVVLDVVDIVVVVDVDNIVDVAEDDSTVGVVSDVIVVGDNVVVGEDTSSSEVIITVTATALETDATANVNKTAFRAMANFVESRKFSPHPKLKLPKRVPIQKLNADHK